MPRFARTRRIATSATVALAATGLLVMGAACPPETEGGDSPQGSLMAAEGSYITTQYAPGRYYLNHALSRDVTQEAVATLLLAIGEDNEVIQVLVNNVAVDPACVQQVERDVLLTTATGANIAELTLPSTSDDLLQLVAVVEDDAQPRVRIGVTLEELTEPLAAQVGVDPGQAVMIAEVAEEGPAAKAGLQRYDVIVRIADEEHASQEMIREYVRACEPGEAIELIIVRRGEQHHVPVFVEAADETIDYTTYLEAVQFDPSIARHVLAGQSLRGVTYTEMLDGNGIDATYRWQPAGTQQLTTDLVWATADASGRWEALVAPQQRIQAQEITFQHPHGVLLELQPRIVNSRIVLDAFLRTTATTEVNVEESVDPMEELRHQVAELKSQIESLERLINEVDNQPRD